MSGPQGPIEPELRAERPIDPNVRIGHVHLRTADIDRVRDFYVVSKGLDEPLNFPDFDYEDWIPPRTKSGKYNEHVAEILKEKLLRE